MPTDPSAPELLERVRERYATARSYRDAGEQTTVYIHDDVAAGSRTERSTFATRFRRPNRFRFIHSEADAEFSRTTSAMWLNASGVGSWIACVPGGGSESHDLQATFWEVDMYAGGTIGELASLLGVFTDGSDPLPDGGSIAATAEINGQRCVAIDSPVVDHRRERLWVAIDLAAVIRKDERSALTAKVLEEQREHRRRILARMAKDDPRRASMEASFAQMDSGPVRPFRTETTTVWHPEFDVEIADSEFEFTPPG